MVQQIKIKETTMFEKVSRCHPDKVADRIAGAVVDRAYIRNSRARVAVEVLTGHGNALIIVETNTLITGTEVEHLAKIVSDCPDLQVTVVIVPQDSHLSKAQEGGLRCGDNGIFKGCPMTEEQRYLATVAKGFDSVFGRDGKYALADKRLTVCQSGHGLSGHCEELEETLRNMGYEMNLNPLGEWQGGIDVDSGATNRKLGSDMGDAVTGGGLHGKDLTKADVSVNVWCHLKAQELGREVTAHCAIGDTVVKTSEGDVPFVDMVRVAKAYIQNLGGFERFAEYGLIR